MKLFQLEDNAIVPCLAMAGLFALLTVMRADAFPSLVPSAMTDEQPEMVMEVALQTGEALSMETEFATSQALSRAPMTIKIGQREQLFDGEFLCELEARAPFTATASLPF